MNTNADDDELRELMDQTWGDVPLDDQKRLLALFRVSNDPYHDQAFGDLSHVEKLTIVANHQLEACQWKDAYRTITAIERIERRRPQALSAFDLARLRIGPEPQQPPPPEAAREPAPETPPSPAPAPPTPNPADIHSARARRTLAPREREAARRAAQSARDRAFRQHQLHAQQTAHTGDQQPHAAPASSHPPFT